VNWEIIYARLLWDREDSQAWTALRLHVLRHARRDVSQRGWQVVEEVVADTVAAVALSFDRAHGADTFRGFVLGHYWNARRQAVRAEERAGVALDDLDVAELPAEIEGPSPELVELLRRALEQLPVRERTAVVLRYFEGASAVAIGQALSATEVNARQIVFRGVRRLRAQLRSAPRDRASNIQNRQVDNVEWERHGRPAAGASAFTRLAPTLAGNLSRSGARD
jgi:RNA polymerase sigma factor (sigma-70 family)